MTAAWADACDGSGTAPASTLRGDGAIPDLHDVEAGTRRVFGDVVADRLTREIGSWRFIGIYFALLLIWMAMNTVAWIRHWDPYPFIFLNLILSFQGAFAAPVILMSQNRQESRDRLEEQRDHSINLRAEREVAELQALGTASLAEIAALRADQAEIARKLEVILAATATQGALPRHERRQPVAPLPEP